MLTEVHILLTYKCTFECDHCFVYSSPFSEGTMTLSTIRLVIEESRKIGTVEWIYFEGGEPFLYYPLLLEGVRLAREAGFKAGIVTNGYWATSEEDAKIWLQPLQKLGIDYLSISNDTFHYDTEEDNSAKRALTLAHKLGIPSSQISIKRPCIEEQPGQGQGKGSPVVGGGALFRGRAVEKLVEGLPRRLCSELTQCSHEDLQLPSRVHVDPYGHIQACQGISLGNLFQVEFSEIMRSYDVNLHPICAPLTKGGPAALAEHYGVEHEKTYIDECHFCYSTRLALLKRFPQFLAPKQVYGFQ